MSFRENRYVKQLQPVTLPISALKGIGTKRAVHFARKGINTILDLFYFTPLRYEDRTSICPIGSCREGAISLVKGRVVSGREERFYCGRTRIFKIRLKDETGGLELLWFNYRKPHLARFATPGTELFAYGMVKMNLHRLQMIHPELWTREGQNEMCFSPVYSSVTGISTPLMRSIMRNALKDHLGMLTDPVPEEIIKVLGLPPLDEAVLNVHFPSGDSVFSELNQQRTPFHRRLLFDRFFLVMLTIAFRRKAAGGRGGLIWGCPPKLENDFSAFFPFNLTSDQENAFREILRDLGAGKPMNRLLLGDVGCGKTAVAALTACVAVLNNSQAALMAPTQVLANQHFEYFSSLPREMGFRTVLLTGALKNTVREEACKNILSGSCNLVIGTQSLIQDKIRFRNLGLVMIDEQQRFGVRERALMDRKGRNPHQLVMTATPIPRTLAMTVYGDMDISSIREHPGRRLPVITRLVKEAEKRRVFDFLTRRIALGQQAFVICPVIEASEEADLKNAVEMSERLKKILPPPVRIGLIHGRLAADEKDSVMADFRAGKIHALVGTTVVEVGVHVPVATVMIIEHPERFGLAQVHQLRGRIGRGSERGVCVLMVSDALSDKALSRLQFLAENDDGFEIAQKDLEQRGQGELVGMRQTGLGELDFFEMMKEPDLLLLAKEKADLLLESDPGLDDPPHRGLRNFVEAMLANPIDF